MPVPVNKPLTLDRMTANTASVATGQAVAFPSPWFGRVGKIGVTIGATATASGTATLAVTINGGADISGGALTIPSGTVNATISAQPAATTYVSEDDVIGFAFTGAGTAGTNPCVFAEVKQGG